MNLNILKVRGDLWTSAQPSAGDLHELADMGVKTLINLRMSHEEGQLPNPLALAEKMNLKYHHLPIESPQGISLVNASALTKLIESNLSIRLVYCRSANRVGALLALAHFSQHHSLEHALQFGRTAGLAPQLESRVYELLQQNPVELRDASAFGAGKR